MSNTTDLLSAEEERTLVLDGSEAAVRTLVLAHRPIAQRAARVFESERCGRDDLEAEGMLALLVAARKFDSTNGTRFGPYARVAVQRALLRYLAINDHGVFRLPEAVWDEIRKARKQPVRNGREAALVALGEPPASLSAPLPEGGEFGDFIAGDLNPGPDKRAVAGFDLEDVLRFATTRERRAIVLRFGLDEKGQPLDYKSVAKDLGVSVRTARRYAQTGLDKIREARRADKWRHYDVDEEPLSAV